MCTCVCILGTHTNRFNTHLPTGNLETFLLISHIPFSGLSIYYTTESRTIKTPQHYTKIRKSKSIIREEEPDGMDAPRHPQVNAPFTLEHIHTHTPIQTLLNLSSNSSSTLSLHLKDTHNI